MSVYREIKTLLPLAFLAAIFGGLLGLAVLLTLYVFSNLESGKDKRDKHGIGEQTSRLGGVAIFLGVLAYFLSSCLWSEPSESWKAGENLFGYEIVALAIGLVGFCEDCRISLKPGARLMLASIIVIIGIFSYPELIPGKVDFWFAADFLNQPYILALGVLFVVVGFINAGNISDGANGLLALNAMSVFFLIYLETVSPLYFSLLVSLAVFSIYNIFSGRIFLGDFGSYALSALMALCCLDLYVSSEASAWFFASLLSYPCIEIVRVMVNRVLKHKSPFSADNSHVHNKIYEAISGKGLKALAANSLTGFCLGFCFSVVPLALAVSDILPWDEEAWGLYFLFSVIVHLLMSRINVTSSQPQSA